MVRSAISGDLSEPSGSPARDCNRGRYLTQLQAELGGELVLGEGADRLLGDLAVLEAGYGRDARYAVVHRGRRVVVHVELEEAHVVALLGHLLEDRGDTPARHAPRRPEVHYDRRLRLENVALECRVSYLGNRHTFQTSVPRTLYSKCRYSSTPDGPFFGGRGATPGSPRSCERGGLSARTRRAPRPGGPRRGRRLELLRSRRRTRPPGARRGLARGSGAAARPEAPRGRHRRSRWSRGPPLWGPGRRRWLRPRSGR